MGDFVPFAIGAGPLAGLLVEFVLHPRCVGISSDNFLVVTSSLSGLPKGNEEVPSGKWADLSHRSGLLEI